VGRTESELVEGAVAALEIVIDGVDEGAVSAAMFAAIKAAAGPGTLAIAAGNYGGKLGKFHFHLHELLASSF
jgi:formylmethanofuran--tetrahydromethanopterin N-formyltransferase